MLAFLPLVFHPSIVFISFSFCNPNASEGEGGEAVDDLPPPIPYHVEGEGERGQWITIQERLPDNNRQCLGILAGTSPTMDRELSVVVQ